MCAVDMRVCLHTCGGSPFAQHSSPASAARWGMLHPRLAHTPRCDAMQVYGAYYRKLSKKTQAALADANAVAEEVLSSMATVRAHAAQVSRPRSGRLPGQGVRRMRFPFLVVSAVGRLPRGLYPCLHSSLQPPFPRPPNMK